MIRKPIDHRLIKNDLKYQCSKCEIICLGEDLDWFSDEPDLTICPVCNNRIEFFEVDI